MWVMVNYYLQLVDVQVLTWRVGCDVESEGPSKILELPTISHPVEVVSCDESADSDSSVRL